MSEEENIEREVETMEQVDSDSSSEESESSESSEDEDVDQDESVDLNSLFSEEEQQKAAHIFTITKINMTHCAQCNELVFGNWIYEEGKYMCFSCRSVLT